MRGLGLTGAAAAVLGVALAGAAHAACDPAKAGGGTVIYDGTSTQGAPMRIALVISSDGGVSGLLAGADSSRDTPLSGQMTDGGNHLRLTETGASGKGSFDGAFADSDPRFTGGLNCEVIQGVWKPAPTAATVTLRLTGLRGSGAGKPGPCFTIRRA